MMYLEFYQLAHAPFDKGTPSSELFQAESQMEAFNRLVYAASGRLFCVLTGECGCGKTTILRKLKDTLDDKRYEFLYVADSKLTPRNFYNAILSLLGREGAFYRGDSRRKLHHEIEMSHALGHREMVVVVDEAHLLDKEMLEELRFLLNFKMDSVSPLGLILSGQNELEEKLAKRSCAAIKQRIDLHCRLSPLGAAETGQYIAHHLRRAGADGPIFSESAVQMIFAYSAGSARLVNKVCACCLMFGCSSQAKIITAEMVKEVIDCEIR
jgi:type II secretory pathway predicted ATPase ExeA